MKLWMFLSFKFFYHHNGFIISVILKFFSIWHNNYSFKNVHNLNQSL